MGGSHRGEPVASTLSVRLLTPHLAMKEKPGFRSRQTPGFNLLSSNTRLAFTEIPATAASYDSWPMGSEPDLHSQARAKNLSKLHLKDNYQDSNAVLLTDFYLPCLNETSIYKRSSGYFSSALWTILGSDLLDFFESDGIMRIVTSPELSREDAEAIAADKKTESEVINDSLTASLSQWDLSSGNNAPSSLLRHLIAKGRVEIRIAIKANGEPGILHDKVGIYEDPRGNLVTFCGSVNETAFGWSSLGNHEQFETFRSWENDEQERRANRHQRDFDKLWAGFNRTIKILKGRDLPSVFLPREDDLPFDQCRALLKNRLSGEQQKPKNRSKNQTERPLQEHQVEVLQDWRNNNCRGLITFVTGGGKTLTALSAIRDWVTEGKPVLVLVPSRLLFKQWKEEIELELSDLDPRIYTVGAGTPRPQWQENLSFALREHFPASRTIVLATYQSARTEAFLNRVPEGEPILLVADEAHRLGAADTRVILERINAEGRLGLSATPTRFGDPAGTASIYSYFDRDLLPTFGIKDAIAAGRLVPYQYVIHTVPLNEVEDESFAELTEKINSAIAKNNGSPPDEPWFQSLLRQRANLVKEASNKAEVVNSIAQEGLTDGAHWLIYCNSREHIDEIVERLEESDIDTLEYHSLQTDQTHVATLNYFEHHGGALVAIKCLDEGIDIPTLDTAVIAASSTNPREYIQRRGRVLRSSPATGKQYATVHDLLVTRLNGTIALKSEITRAIEFAQTAENESSVYDLRRLMEKSGIDPDLLIIEDAFEDQEEEDDD